MPSTFLTTTGFFNFCNLNPFLAAIFLSINIPVVLLSKSIFTIMLLCIFTFFTLMFSYTFLNILNILLMFFYLFFSCTILFGTPVCVPPCYAFPSIGYATTLQFHCGFFFPVLYSGHRILLFFLFQYSFFYYISFFILYTLYSCYLSSPCFFLSPVSCFLAKIVPYIFYLSFKEKFLFLIFIDLNSLVFIFFILYIGCYCLLHDPSPLK